MSVSCCGTECSTCYCYGDLCKGCNESEGKVFHQPEGKACAIYECVIHEKKLKHCGQCKETPCEIWKQTRDPKYTDEQFQQSITERMENLRKL